MRRTLSLVLGAAALSLIGCTEEIVSPVEIIESPFPELLSPYESFFDLNTLEQRRDALIQRMPENAIAVITTNSTYLRNGDVDYEFRPASTFYYLTGFDEPNASAIIRQSRTAPNTSELILFVETRTEGTVRWLGPSWGIQGATEVFGADEAYDRAMFESAVESFASSGLYATAYTNLSVNEDVLDAFYNAGGGTLNVEDIDPIVNDLRAVKSQIELNAIRSAVDVTVQALLKGIEVIAPGVHEYEVDAVFDYVLRRNGSLRAAFPTIVASGPNINYLHYDAGYRQMLDGDLVMIDFGAEYGFYAADVTRTIPVNGTFTPEQATVYNIVLEAHRAVIQAAAPGVSYYDLYYRARDIVLDGLLGAGIISGSKVEIISSRRYRLYIPAGLGHPVGLDVHDPWLSDDGGSRIFQPNMVIAFEPHIYLTEGDMTVSPAYRGIAARIEDTVLITSSGSEVMSSTLPWEIVDIEALMQ